MALWPWAGECGKGHLPCGALTHHCTASLNLSHPSQSFSTFNFSSLVIAGTVSSTTNTTVSATVCNIAGPAGAEVAQLYLGYPAAAHEPPQLLKGFVRVELAPGQCSVVKFALAAKDVAVWGGADGWTLVPGTYTVRVGASSRDIRLSGSLPVTQLGRSCEPAR